MNLLFWNLNKNSIARCVASLLQENDVDIAVLAEFDRIAFSELETAMEHRYQLVRDYGGYDKVCFVAKRGVDIVIPSGQSRYAFGLVNGGDSRLIIVGTHLPDRINHPDRGSRIDCIRRLLADLSELAKAEHCNNLVIIGDMNAGPFDSELLQVDSFNAVLFKPIIDKSLSRIVDGVERRFLYSPMLSCFEERGRACGSYYHVGDFRSQYWHCYDQVIVSRSLVRRVEPVYLQSAGGLSLMNYPRPNSKISDHLPLFVSISKEDRDE